MVHSTLTDPVSADKVMKCPGRSPIALLRRYARAALTRDRVKLPAARTGQISTLPRPWWSASLSGKHDGLLPGRYSSHMARSLRILIPPEFAAGVRCSRGATRQVPVAIKATGVQVCEITANAEGGAIEPIHRRVTPSLSGGQIQVILTLIARTASPGRYWITVNATCDDVLPQAAGFFLEITE